MGYFFLFMAIWIVLFTPFIKKKHNGAYFFALLPVALVLTIWVSDAYQSLTASPPSKPVSTAEAAALAKKQKADAHKAKIDALFNAWDGSCLPLTALIKANMNDPGSYQNVETRYADYGDYLLVITKFRGRNAFGALVLNTVKAKVSLDGKVLDVISQQ